MGQGIHGVRGKAGLVSLRRCNALKSIKLMTSISSFKLSSLRKIFKRWPFTLKIIPSSSWSVIAQCDDVLMTEYGPFH
jgi:hypothetical protein